MRLLCSGRCVHVCACVQSIVDERLGLRLRLTLLSRRFPLSLQLPWTLTLRPAWETDSLLSRPIGPACCVKKLIKAKRIKTTQKRFKRLKKAAAKLSQEDLVELLRVEGSAGSSSSSEGQGRSGASALKPAPSSFSD